ncbi:serine hydrolase domain-containing protein [Shewanella sedimentimangrovi]|uniref:Beta-lactamase family protein n=1 Tax=Shewanella sedimentimangrovi TaxID=2814293 RepID=A0ABX7R6D0_9GAMM|nr:serine hydrolase domain-containing protein [Shewanella sedimentimangrovi]QSX38345.1 beta-lactamase family protein [Shewanella sedimentimangrovi]
MGVTDLAFASSAPPKTQVKTALGAVGFTLKDCNFFRKKEMHLKVKFKNYFPALCALAIVSASTQADETDDIVYRIMSQRNIPGLQLVVIKDNCIVKSAEYGQADVEANTKVSKTTAFSIYSMTKAFTGVAIMQLVEQGKLQLDDQLGIHFPDLPQEWKQLTVQQILSHTSGLPEIIKGPLTELVGAGDDGSAWQTVQTLPMQSVPNERFQYNQTGYVILKKLVEKYNGDSFEKFLAQGLTSTMPITKANSFTESGSTPTAVAKQYISNGSGYQSLEINYSPLLWAAAGMKSTANELAHFLIALQSGQILTPSAKMQMWQPAVLANGKTAGFSSLENGYAAGWQVLAREKDPAVSSSGGNASTMVIYPEKNVSIIVLTNLLGSQPIEFTDEIANQFFDTRKTTNELSCT